MNKFEEMLERLINEDKAGAEELFHEIVVEKSRSIYENLLAEDYEEDEDEFEVDEEDPMAAMGGDETDELEMDISMDDEGSEMDTDTDTDMDMDMDDEGEEELEDRVVDIEDALDELKAEFEKMMSDEESTDDADDEEGEEMDMDMDTDMEIDAEDDEDEDEDMDMDDTDDEAEKESFDPTDQVATMREYVEKVTAKMGDDGVQKQSTVAGKNDMGGTAANIARADKENGVEANKGNLKGSALSNQKAKEENMGNVNVPGGKASKSMKNQPKGHGAEKKGTGETADNKQSTLRARK